VTERGRPVCVRRTGRSEQETQELLDRLETAMVELRKFVEGYRRGSPLLSQAALAEELLKALEPFQRPEDRE